jgi:hypothetical protein
LVADAARVVWDTRTLWRNPRQEQAVKRWERVEQPRL